MQKAGLETKPVVKRDDITKPSQDANLLIRDQSKGKAPKQESTSRLGKQTSERSESLLPKDKRQPEPAKKPI